MSKLSPTLAHGGNAGRLLSHGADVVAEKIKHIFKTHFLRISPRSTFLSDSMIPCRRVDHQTLKIGVTNRSACECGQTISSKSSGQWPLPRRSAYPHAYCADWCSRLVNLCCASRATAGSWLVALTQTLLDSFADRTRDTPCPL